jgi:hypothetical protein
MYHEVMLMFYYDEIVTITFVIAEEKVFAVGRRDILPVNTGQFNGWSRRVPVIIKPNAQFIEYLV